MCCADGGLNAVVKELEQEEPTVAMSPGDAADLGRCRRGVEPLRIVVMPQYDRQIVAPIDRGDAGSCLMALSSRRRMRDGTTYHPVPG